MTTVYSALEALLDETDVLLLLSDLTISSVPIKDKDNGQHYQMHKRVLEESSHDNLGWTLAIWWRIVNTATARLLAQRCTAHVA